MERRRAPIYLPDSYWWAHDTGGATLHHRYGAEATVTASEVKILAEGPFREVKGPCRSIEQGMRFAERLIQARTNYGLTPEQAERFWANKQWRARWKPRRPAVQLEGVEYRDTLVAWEDLLSPEALSDEELRFP